MTQIDTNITSPSQPFDNPKPISGAMGCIGMASFLILTWLCCALGPLSLFSPLLLVVAVLWCMQHRLKTAFAVLLFLNPFSFLAVRALIDYRMGNVWLHDTGMPRTSDLGLDRRYRCRVDTSGCFPLGNEWVAQLAYDIPARCLIDSLGWMPGTYIGPFPTEKEAIEALNQNEEPISVSDLCNDTFKIDDQLIQLDRGVGQGLYDGAQLKAIFRGSAESPNITGAIWKEECIILRLPLKPQRVNEKRYTLIVVISRSVGRPFAYYSENISLANVFPVNWKASWGGGFPNRRLVGSKQ